MKKERKTACLVLRRKEGATGLRMKLLKFISAQCREGGFCFEFFIKTKSNVFFFLLQKTTTLLRVKYSLIKIKSFSLFEAELGSVNQDPAINTMCAVNRQMLHVLVAGPPLMIHEPRLTSADVSRQGNLSHRAGRGGLSSVPLNEFSCEIIF